MWDGILLLVAGLVLGGVLGWLWASGRSRAAMARELADLQSRSAAADSTTRELREQLTQREAAIDAIRGQLDSERQSRITVETRLQETAKKFDEQRQLLQDAEQKLKESFESLSARALQTNAEQFLTSARKTLEAVLAEARGDLGKRQEAINTLIKPLSESLKRYEDQIRGLEQARQKAYGSLEEQVKMLTSTNQQLQQETGKLVTSLRDPKVRGRWGEIALRRAAELAGLSEHCDFDEQAQVSGDEDTRFRPDMIVRLPGGRTVAVDAKAVLDAYLDAVAATDEEARRQHLERHARQVSSRVRELSSKSYWDKLDSTPEFVVLFLPAESFFSAAVETEPRLIENAMESRVLLASPTTLIALLKAIAFGWRQEQIAENAKQISELGRTLFERMHTLVDNLSKVGSGLGSAIRAYNLAVGSLERRVLPAARKFKELGAAGGDDIPRIEPVERTPRELDSSRFDNS